MPDIIDNSLNERLFVMIPDSCYYLLDDENGFKQIDMGCAFFSPKGLSFILSNFQFRKGDYVTVQNIKQADKTDWVSALFDISNDNIKNFIPLKCFEYPKVFQNNIYFRIEGDDGLFKEQLILKSGAIYRDKKNMTVNLPPPYEISIIHKSAAKSVISIFTPPENSINLLFDTENSNLRFSENDVSLYRVFYKEFDFQDNNIDCVKIKFSFSDGKTNGGVFLYMYINVSFSSLSNQQNIIKEYTPPPVALT